MTTTNKGTPITSEPKITTQKVLDRIKERAEIGKPFRNRSHIATEFNVGPDRISKALKNYDVNLTTGEYNKKEVLLSKYASSSVKIFNNITTIYLDTPRTITKKDFRNKIKAILWEKRGIDNTSDKRGIVEIHPTDHGFLILSTHPDESEKIRELFSEH